MPDVLCTDNMKIDTSVLRQLREERSWTQEHLATVSGVSLRTIQRIEREGNASADSRLALAAAFGVDVPVLAGRADASAQPPPASAAVGEAPEQSDGRGTRSFLRHLLIYLVVGACLVYADFSGGGAGHWVQWPLVGWGLGVLLHGLNARMRQSGSIANKVRVYLAMSAGFVAIDLFTTGRLTWAFYPILGWGAGLFLARYGKGKASQG